MNIYTLEELADMHAVYADTHHNGRAAQRLYSRIFPNRRRPSHTIFEKINRRLRETGLLRPQNHRLGPRRTARTPMVEEMVLGMIAENRGTSTRSIARTLEVSNFVVWQILHEDRLHPFHRQKVQDLNENDFGNRVMFCNWYIRKCEEDELFSGSILFSDESLFTREGLFNSHNNHVWNNDNPHAKFIRSFQNRFSLNVWGGIIGDHLLGPYFLPARLNGASYLQFLEDTLPELLEDVPIALRQRMWFQHDGAPPHFARVVRNHLDEAFLNRWIGRGGPVSWPARSPDLTSLDFFLWGHVKEIVYKTQVNTVEELRGRIVAAFEDIRETPEILTRVQASMLKRCNACVEVGGGHFENLQ